jgi:hypothetical protein
MFASQAQVAAQSAGSGWIVITLIAAGITAFWRVVLKIILFVIVVMTLVGVVAVAEFVHRM